MSIRELLFGILVVALAPNARAQTQIPVAVRVRVRVSDSAGARVPGADVALTRGLHEVLSHASTDAAGMATLSGTGSSDNYNIVIRKIGYARADRFVRALGDSAVTIEVTLIRNATALPTVAVTAEESRKQRDYHLNADDLENSGRPVIDGTDILKLRPEMIASRAGWRTCGYIQSVWVNGVRVVLAPIEPNAIARRAAFGLPMASSAPPRTRPGRKSGTQPGPTTQRPDPAPIDTVLSILSTIHPEHIAEVSFQDCLDNTVAKNHSDMAMFIALKPGIAYANGRGSYVLENANSAEAGLLADARTSPSSSTSTEEAPQLRTVDSTSINIGAYPPYRFRVIGLFDDANGGTVEGAEVIDTKSGLRVLTSVTGTASLFFLPDGGSTVLVRKSGLRDTTFFVPITPADTTPITLLLRKP